MKAIRRITVRPVLPEPLRPLSRLARNLRWSWHQPTRELFARLDPDRWDASGRDPVRLLGSVPPARLARLAADEDFLRRLAGAAADLDYYLTGERWYQQQPGDLPAAVAYFSPEFGLTAALPQYSGGLGILAGDHLKAASDLGAPLIGVGLLYRHGYFRQSLAHDGWQQEHYPVLDPHELPLSPLHEDDGTPTRVRLALPGGRDLRARVWLAQVGRVPLLLLDSDVEENDPRERDVTDRLYGGGSEHRLLQEMLLGMGGVRAVRSYCRITGHPEPEVFHTNEGHAGFLGVERIRELSVRGLDFDAALQAVRAGTVFTTHTPVPAGIDRFDADLVARHFGPDAEAPDIDVERVLRLGRESYPGGDPALFNMAVMGLRLGQRANGVSLLHGRVSREMFAGLWPGFDADEVPITSITNGVHAPTWTAPEVQRLTAGADRAAPGDGTDPEALAGVPDEDLWRLRGELRGQLVAEVRSRLYASWRQRGAAPAELGWIDQVLDPAVLTIGFARRVPSYKRLTLMLRDPARLTALLLHPERPVQIVVAGKAHPADDGGKRLVQELVRFTDDPRVRHRIVFLPDYGMGMAQRLYPGCDVWLNNPLRPLEACGTSGMKAALNGCLNLSVLDGWWDEWYEPDFGWAIPTADGHDAAGRHGHAGPGGAGDNGALGRPADTVPGRAVLDEERRDDLEAAALYDLLERRIAPCFYEQGSRGLPDRWIEMVRRTLGGLGPKVLAGRMVREYVERLYTPAAHAHRVHGPEAARALAAWKSRVHAGWPRVAVDHVEAAGAASTAELGATQALRVRVRLGDLSPDDVEVQAVTGRVDTEDRIAGATSFPLKPVAGPDLEGRWSYEGPLTLDRTGPFGYTVRILPSHPLLASGAELGLVALPDDGTGTPATAEGAGVVLR
ncbi:alpha-glucan family phosphorylase [Streptomyces sp. TS71-3]|uniref:alpha-glucan family phosphorylase n=1 Tax=Streptomyces sp. TS71-3 TaxID=2733862 RepID=UPI001B00F09F|nr:alpha-glucan family phosphorylase [Streptomyces sp. TS71-3]GHJ36141.1 alpha-1,4 glucan phosphorylase [Streptomyces sp. TS71-3]